MYKRQTQAYVDYVVGVVDSETGSGLHVEQHFTLNSLSPPFDAGGTADAVIFLPSRKLIEVVDLKGGRGVVVVEQAGEGQWRMLEPFEADANTELVMGLARELQFAIGHEYVDNPNSLDDYYLNPPGARVTVYSGKEGTPQTLLIGGGTRTNDKSMLVAKRSDAPTVFQIDGALYGYFPKTPDAYRENRLLTRSALDLERIDYQAGEVNVALVKGEDKRWRLAEPLQEPADQEIVSGFISTLLKVRGESFPPISLAEAGLAGGAAASAGTPRFTQVSDLDRGASETLATEG